MWESWPRILWHRYFAFPPTVLWRCKWGLDLELELEPLEVVSVLRPEFPSVLEQSFVSTAYKVAWQGGSLELLQMGCPHAWRPMRYKLMLMQVLVLRDVLLLYFHSLRTCLFFRVSGFGAGPKSCCEEEANHSSGALGTHRGAHLTGIYDLFFFSIS